MQSLKRPLLYFILGALCKITPYILTIFCIMWTQDRIEGMKIGVIPGLIAPHLIFGLVFISDSKLKKFLYSILVAGSIFGINFLLLRYDLTIETNWDKYGYWDLAIINFLTGLFIWEIFYHIHKKK